MKLRMQRKVTVLAVLLIALVISLGQPAAVNAQEPVTFESVLVEVWPEYDQPSALVMYHLTLTSTVKLPAEVAIRIPERAGRPHAVATQDEAGLLNLNYTTATQDGWLLIQFTTPTPQVRLEYYDPSLTIEGPKRTYTYRWPGDYAVNNLTMQVQQPANASEMAFVPEMGSGQQAQDGLTYYNMLVGQLNAGTGFDMQISYNKPDNTLTNPNSFEQAQPVQPVDSNTTGRVTVNDFLPWILGGFGILLIAVGAFWYWRTGQLNTVPERPRHSRRTNAGGQMPSTADDKQSIYCSQCGKRAGPGDLFCRSCGTKLRV